MLNFVIALPCEARPLIGHFQLERRDHAHFPVYTNDTLSLIVSGVGKIQAAAATGYLQARATPESIPAWFNLGIAGHASLDIGTPLLAHKIADRASGKTYYPAFTSRPCCATAQITTVESPETNYPDDSAYEMEASGFWPCATRFSSAELVQCCKIVSDNKGASLAAINAAKVEALITAHLALIESLVAELTQLQAQLAPTQLDPSILQAFLQRWHFTSTQRHQLRQLLANWQVLAPEADPFATMPAGLRSSRQVLTHLHRQLAALPVPLP